MQAKDIKVRNKAKAGIVTGVSVFGPTASSAPAGDTGHSAHGSSEPLVNIDVVNEKAAHIVTGYAQYSQGYQVDVSDSRTTISTGNSTTDDAGPNKVAQWLTSEDMRCDEASVTSHMSHSTWEGENINDESHPDNCWLCSIGGYFRIQVSKLLGLTQTRGAATEKEILQVYKDNGARATPRYFLDWNGVIDYLKTKNQLVPGAKLKVLLGYNVAAEFICHMVVLKARKTGHGEIQYRVIDFQRDAIDPRRITENQLPSYATNPFLVIETDYDVYKTNN